jgi:hypothetical protein
MKSHLLLVAAAITAGVRTVQGHWNYNNLIVNGKVVGDPYQYVRRTNNSNTPLQQVNSTDMRCNAGGASGTFTTTNGTTTTTQTYTVRAGLDELGFAIADSFGHPGVQQVYLSRAPAGVAAAAYDGGGDWVRIYATGTKVRTINDTSDNATTVVLVPETGPEGLVWAVRRARAFRFPPLPADTPPGEYLLRAEGLALHAAHKRDCAQFYVGCAQLRVVNAGYRRRRRRRRGGAVDGAVPGPSVRIPGVYNDTTPGVLIPDFWTKITEYTPPGPELWPPGTQVQQ